MKTRVISLDALLAYQHGLGLNHDQMSMVLGVAISTYKSWITQREVPLPIQYSVQHLMAVNKRTARRLIRARINPQKNSL